MGYMQFVCSLGEAQMPGSSIESGQRGQRRKFARHETPVSTSHKSSTIRRLSSSQNPRKICPFKPLQQLRFQRGASMKGWKL
jgi:hypothetical protein